MALYQDIKYAFRQFHRNLAFTATAVTTLGVAIGLNTAVLGISDNVLVRKLPYRDPDALVRIFQQTLSSKREHVGVSAPEYLDYTQRATAFEQIAAFRYLFADLTGAGDASRVAALRVTPNLFSILGVHPQMGTLFDTSPERVAVVSYAFWQARLGARQDVLGTMIQLNDTPYTVVGVMPPEFTFPADRGSVLDRPDMWVPASFSQQELNDRGGNFSFSVIARVHPGVTLDQANDDVRRVAAIMFRENAVYRDGLDIRPGVEPFGEEDARRAKPVLMLLFAAVALVWAIACANTAHLLVARLNARSREMLVRAALGASAGRLIWQSLTEAVCLASLAGVAGFAIAWTLGKWAGTLTFESANLAAVLDARYAAIAVACTLLTGLACGLGASWRRQSLTVSWRVGGSRKDSRFRSMLVVAEAASTMILLAASGMLIHSLWQVLQTPLGFAPDHLLVARTTFSRQRYPNTEIRRQEQQAIIASLAALPRVEAVGVTTNLPLVNAKPITYRLPGQSLSALRPALAELIDTGYFGALRIPLLEGRNFTDADRPGTRAVAIVNSTLARRIGVGKRVIWGERDLLIVGIVGDVHARSLDSDVEPTLYLPIYQAESVATANAAFVIRAPSALTPAIRAAMREAHPGAVISEIVTMNEVVANSLAERRLLVVIVGGFGAIALFLAAVGLFGLLSYQVTERRTEIGLRIALGASGEDLIGGIMKRGLALTGAGIAVGLVISAMARPFLQAFLYRLSPLDPASLTLAAVALLATAAGASYLPARRAAGVDPMTVLRSE